MAKPAQPFRLQYILYTRYSYPMRMNAEVLTMLDEHRVSREEMGILHLDSDTFYDSRASFVAPFIETGNFYIDKPTKHHGFSSLKLLLFVKQLL